MKPPELPSQRIRFSVPPEVKTLMGHQSMPRLPGMLDQALRRTFRDLSTFMLIVAFVAVPLHLVHSYAFRNVIEVRELHAQIETFPADRTVRDVGPDRLTDYRASLKLLGLLEAGLLVILVRPTRRALLDADAGGVPTASGAWAGSLHTGGGYLRALGHAPGPLLVAAVLALLIGFLAERVGLLAAEPLGDAKAWLGVGLAQAFARCLAAPFFLVTWAFASDGAKEGVLGGRSSIGGER